jgi:hypothetical protein
VRVIGLAGEHSSEVSGIFLNLWVSMEEVVGPCDVPQEQSLCIGVEWIEVYSWRYWINVSSMVPGTFSMLGLDSLVNETV